MMAEIIIGIISIIVDIIALLVSIMALNSVNTLKNVITTNTDKSDVRNELKKVDIKGDYVGRDKNSNNKK